MMLDVERVLKVVIVGPSAVGKTTLVRRYTDGVFIEGYKKTLGVDFVLKKIDVKPTDQEPPVRHVSLQLWDFAGESRFRAILQHYLVGTHVVVLAFDGSQAETFEVLPHWLKTIRSRIPDAPIILIATKNDLAPQVSPEAVQRFIHQTTIKDFFRTSSKTGQQVDAVFQRCVHYGLAQVCQ